MDGFTSEEIDGYRSPDGTNVVITAIRLRGSSENILREPLSYNLAAWWKPPMFHFDPTWESFTMEN